MILEQNLLPKGSLNRPGTKLQSKKAVVLHYVGNPNTTPAANINFWRNRKDYGSAHAVIGIDGKTQLAIPWDEVAYHAGTSGRQVIGGVIFLNNVNNHSVGLELCHKTWTSGYTTETMESLGCNLFLLRELGFEYLFVHGEITGKECDFWFRTNKDALNELALKFGYKRPAFK